ncbi:hypothetical protein RYZ20_08805 [Thioclava sp. A2]|uniref:hypothetical protein n=1 Tax=Thioclava sp. FCG-A2 TaxID=3080562 RepID=UPI002953B8E2|nr:hypothetical protein [Thioclava sp. A2]MDV7270997.1 hypothetical protein [Thioclava sp. A2]
MKRFAAAMLCAGFALPAGAETTEDLLAEILDRQLGTGAVTATIHADGTISGDFHGKVMGGAWHIEDGFYCRSLTLDGEPLGQEDCIAILRDGDGYRFDGERGTKAGHVYRPAE